MIKQLKKLYSWIKLNREQILYTGGVYIACSYLLNLPYLNLIKIYLSAFPLVMAWIFAVIVFRPRKEKILMVGLGIFLVNFLFSLLNVQRISESLADVSYFMILTYVILSLREIKLK